LIAALDVQRRALPLRELFRGMRFLFTGVVTAIVQYATLIGGAQLVPPVAAAVVAYAVATPVNYFMNYHFTFDSSTLHKKAFIRFMVVSITGMTLNTLIFWLAISLGLYYVVAQIIATVVLTLWNYLGLRIWTFA
jgi:putative flippase GtrA